MAELAIPFLTVSNLAFSFKNRPVLHGVSFAQKRSSIVGVLGQNGAGKSTLFGLLSGIHRHTPGQILWDGAAISKLTRARTGVVFQEPSLDQKLSARQNLMLAGQIFGLSPDIIAKKTTAGLEAVQLADRAAHQVKTFSGGMKRKLDLMRALLHEPELLLMDEPTAGLDVEAFRQFWQMILRARQERGLAVLLTTHRFDEAEFCDWLLVLHGGQIVAQGTPAELKRRVSGDRVVLKVNGLAENPPAPFEKGGVLFEWVGEEILAIVEDGPTLVPRIVEAFPEGSVESISVRKPTLADAFLKIIQDAAC